LKLPDQINAAFNLFWNSIHLHPPTEQGPPPRDVTPEAISVMRVELPGFGEVMRAGSMKLTPNAILSRSLAAIFDRSSGYRLPGKPQGAVDCL
jgi:molybdopterin adenylyltransferase